MKQNLLFNQASALGKRFAMVLTMLLVVGVGQAWGADYELVTSAPSDWSGEYLIVAGTSALSGGTSLWGTTTTVTVSNNKISTEANISVTISKGGTSGTYYIYMNSNSKYLKEVTSNTFATADNSDTDTEWKISLSNGDAQIACASATTRYLRLNGTSGYRCYTSATGTLPKLYKKAPSFTITATSNNDSYGTVTVSGTTITAAPNDGYRVKSGDAGYTVTSGTAVVTNNGDNTFTVTPESDCTVQINFESKGCIDKGASSITSGTSSGDDYGPLHAYYDYSTSQILYTKSDLDLATGKKGSIKSIYFEYAGSSEMDARTINIYMANTTLSSLSTNSYVPYSSFSLVYEGSFSCSSAGWYEITLDTPFEYSGTGNLAVMVDDNTNSYQNDKNFKYHSADGAQIYKRQDNTDIDPENWTPDSEIDYRPNAKFCIQEADMTPVTVTLMDNGATITEDLAGAGVTLPPRDGCDGYTFAGWTKSWNAPQTSWTTTAPILIPAGSYTPTANENLYPVYTKTEGGGSEPTDYSAGDVGSFMIASNVGNKWYAIPENPTLSSGKITGVEITVSQTAGGVNYVSTANAEGYTWTIADATNGQTISDGTKYIYHSNGGASGTSLAYGTSTSYTWKIEKEDNGLTFKGMNGSTTNSCGLLFNGSVFGGYALSNEDASGYYRIQVLPIGGGSTTYYISVPDCSTETLVSVLPKIMNF